MNVVAFLLISNLAWSAPQRPSLELSQFVRETLSLDSEYQGALIDKKIASVRKDAADNLFRGDFTLSPYLTRYQMDPEALNTSFDEEGVKVGYTQFLPLGTQLIFGVDNSWDNTRQTSAAQENRYTIGLVQPLWRDQFGVARRAARDAFAVDDEAMVARTVAAKHQACTRASNAYIDAWTLERRAQFVNEVLTLATELYRKGEPSFRAGQIGRLDWLGVQSEYLNLQDQKSQAEQRLQQQRLSLNQFAPTARNANLADPSNAFLPLAENLKREQKAGPTYLEEYYQKAHAAQSLKAKSERSLSRPDLDLKVTQTMSDGKLVNQDYEDDHFTVSLNLVWHLNDPSITAQERIARLEADRALVKSEELNRRRGDRFADSVQTLLAQSTQIELERKRTGLLGQITDENKRRFLQGRLDFQDFLRVREQWFDTQNRLLEKQALYWKNLTAFSLTENFPVPFCDQVN